MSELAWARSTACRLGPTEADITEHAANIGADAAKTIQLEMRERCPQRFCALVVAPKLLIKTANPIEL